MRKGRYTQEQIIKLLREQESGVKVTELCRKYGISEQTFYRWRSKYGGYERIGSQAVKSA